MNMKNIRRGFSRASLTVAGIGALIGLLLIVIPVGFLLDVVFFIMGIVTIVVSLPALISLLPLRHTKVGSVSLVCTALMVVAGFLMLFWHSSILLIVVGIVMIAQPVLAIANATDKQARPSSLLVLFCFCSAPLKPLTSFLTSQALDSLF